MKINTSIKINTLQSLYIYVFYILHLTLNIYY